MRMFSRLFGEKKSSIQGGQPSSSQPKHSKEITQTLNALEKLQVVRRCWCGSGWTEHVVVITEFLL